MPGLAEIVRALYGTLRLARLDAGGMAYFETTPDGFWRSFYAYALMAPVYGLFRLQRHLSAPVEVEGFRIVMVEAATYAVIVAAFPLAMAYFCRAIDRSDRYIGYIVALNWSVILQLAVQMPVAMLRMSSEVGGLADALSSLVLLLIMIYLWFVARTALQVSALLAILPVAIDFLLSEIVFVMGDGVIRLQPAAEATRVL